MVLQWPVVCRSKEEICKRHNLLQKHKMKGDLFRKCWGTCLELLGNYWGTCSELLQHFFAPFWELKKTRKKVVTVLGLHYLFRDIGDYRSLYSPFLCIPSLPVCLTVA